MNEDLPAPPVRPALGRPGLDWAGDGALGGPVVAEATAAAPMPSRPTTSRPTPRGAVVSASVRRRAAGFAIDVVILLAIAIVIALVIFYIAGVDPGASQAEFERQLDDLYPWPYLANGIAQFVYNLYWNTRGWSPGKRAVGLRIVNIEGNPPTARQAFRRTLGTLLSGFFGLGYLWALRDRERRTWHDHIGDTYVVETAPEAERARP